MGYWSAKLGAVAIALAAATPTSAFPRFDAHIVWSPSEAESERLSNCSAGDCIAKEMAAHGASPQAKMFHLLLGQFGSAYDGYAEKFVAYGKVDLVQIFLPLQGQGGVKTYLLVNGTPSMVDVSDWKRVSAINLRTNATYRRIQSAYPEVTVWPEAEFVSHQHTKVGEKFVFQHVLLNGCHACAVLGAAHFAYTFGSDGLFTGVKLDSVSVGDPHIAKNAH